ncbi:MAG: IS3 family transposase [Thioclava marina]|uniref:IS3 family transposase n=1 Tax=Thioclava marina TaxID=1915077 RepID=UPI0019988042|nr:IS3 family transposase [Thioclava marina]MBC7147682.1 IS3 family transposase [Thioclava marina]
MFDISQQIEVFPTTVDLKRIDPSLNMRRFYRMSVQPDLFGGACLVREWGRIGFRGQMLIEQHQDEGHAVTALLKLAATKGHKTYPYLLRGLRVERPNQVWCSDITYLPMRRGFLYLVAIMDWHTRKVLSWRISNTLEADFCVEALNEAIHKFGPPEIMNTDQGSQFTSFAWTERLRRSGVRISMDGKGRFLDNIFIERLWRTLKYECVYLHAWETGSETKAAIRKWMTFYNHQRPHSALGGQPPALVYWQKNDINQTDQQVQRVA